MAEPRQCIRPEGETSHGDYRYQFRSFAEAILFIAAGSIGLPVEAAKTAGSI